MSESQNELVESGGSDNADQGTFVPRRRTLNGFAVEPGCAEGLALHSLEAGTVLSVLTRHSRYRIVVLNGARQRVLVTGGSQFPESTEVRLEGATAGGSVLKVGWIGVGLRLEVSIGRRRITTSRVRSITIEKRRDLVAGAPYPKSSGRSTMF